MQLAWHTFVYCITIPEKYNCFLLEFQLGILARLSATKQSCQARKSKEIGRDSLYFMVLFKRPNNKTK